MPSKGLFSQNVIAIIWDFDKTLSPHYMQRPLFDAYDIEEKTFWEEVNRLPGYYAKAGISVHKDTCYLGHLLSYVQTGRMAGLTNSRLREIGAEIAFFPGIPGIFGRLAGVVNQPELAQLDLRVEHYVVSTGLAAMIQGSAISEYINGIYASEFIEKPAAPGQGVEDKPASGEISQIAGFLDNTTKTRALFEINKGVNSHDANISVNDSIPEEERRVPFRNMIYIADGPSDIPSFSVVKKHQGLTYAVYAEDSDEQFEQAEKLQKDERVSDYGPADYTEGSKTDRWLRLKVKHIAQRTLTERRAATESKVSKEPTHIDD